MSQCLQCGHCCQHMSPLSEGSCPVLVEHADPDEPASPIFLCGQYGARPKQCKAHDFSASLCPVGMDVLGYFIPDRAHRRIDRGWALTGGEE